MQNFSVDFNTPNPYKIKVPLSSTTKTMISIKEEPIEEEVEQSPD